MRLLEYFKKHGAESRKMIARGLGVHIQQVSNFAYGARHPNIQQAIRINVLTDGEVGLVELRPDIDWEQMREDLNRAA